MMYVSLEKKVYIFFPLFLAFKEAIMNVFNLICVISKSCIININYVLYLSSLIGLKAVNSLLSILTILILL